MNEKLVLSNEGVFPVVKDLHGNELSELPKTGLPIAGTIQGEGKLAGVPSLFIRLSSCNLRCIWTMDNGEFCRCDTTYASFHPDKTTELMPAEVVTWVKHNIGTIRHVVITGGEPLLQKRPLAQLCQQLKTELNLHLTLETNGTLYDEEVAKWVDLFSISPKLSNSTPTPEKLAFYKLTESGPTKFHNEKRRNTNVLQAYINLCNETNKDLQLKYVVGKKSDAIEIESDFLTHLKNYKKDDILVMPLGASRQELALSAPLVMELAITNGWRYSPRVHIEMFGSKKGV